MDFSSDFSRRYEKLPVNIYDDGAIASKLVADKVVLTIRAKEQDKKKCVLALAASSACIQVYEELVSAYKKGDVSFKNVIVYSIDEYYPLDKNELQSHYRFLKEYLLDYIDIDPKNIKCFDSTKNENIAAYCEEYERSITKDGGIDVLVTSGMGSNEPGSHYNSTTRPITLNYSSRVAAASDFFAIEYVPYHALTMGIETILAAKKVFFLAWGEGKASAIKKLVEGNITDQVPTSYFQNHKNIEILIDTAAAAELTRIKSPWLTGACVWTDFMIRKAVFWLCAKLDKPILKLTDRDYNDNGMSDLITQRG